MAKQQQDREDMLREATALVNRVELRALHASDAKDPVVVGFRRDGSVSFYFGADPVYQFNVEHGFRRGYYQGTLLKAENGKIVQLTQSRDSGQLVFQRHEFDASATSAYLECMKRDLIELKEACQSSAVEIVGAVVEQGTENELIDRIVGWINEHADSIAIAAVPNVTGKRGRR